MMGWVGQRKQPAKSGEAASRKRETREERLNRGCGGWGGACGDV